jgi:hypothetical protein
MDTRAMLFWIPIILLWLKVGRRIVWKDFYTIQENGDISCWTTLKAQSFYRDEVEVADSDSHATTAYHICVV